MRSIFPALTLFAMQMLPLCCCSAVRLPVAGQVRFAWFGGQSFSDANPKGEAWQLHKTNEPVRWQPPPTALLDSDIPHVFFNPPARVIAKGAPPTSAPRKGPVPAPGNGFHSVISGMTSRGR